MPPHPAVGGTRASSPGAPRAHLCLGGASYAQVRRGDTLPCSTSLRAPAKFNEVACCKPMFKVFHISLKNVASVFVWCCIVDLDFAHVANTLFECCKYVIWMLHFLTRDMNVSINMEHMLRQVCNSFSYVVTGSHLIFYGWLLTFVTYFWCCKH
jgi:hypothetical protein